MQGNQSGMTLVEMVVVISILAILALLGSIGAHGLSVDARNSERKATAEATALKLERFYKYNNITEVGHEYPTCQYLKDHVAEIIGDDSLNGKIRCSYIDSLNPAENDGNYWYEPMERSRTTCGKYPRSFKLSAMCVGFFIHYYIEGSDQVQSVESIWKT